MSERKRRPLTTKQKRFATLVAGGQDQTEAYRLSYDAEYMKQSSVRGEACREAKKPHVAKAIAWLHKNRPRSEGLALEVLDELFVCEKLQEVAVSEYSPARTKLGALRTLAQHLGMI